jgi:hypothetical protein
MNLDALDTIDGEAAKRALRHLFARAASPAFGVLPRRELDLLIFQAMRETGVIARGATLYELMAQLKISRAKARNLLFDLEIREAQEAHELDKLAREALAHPQGFAMDGGYLAFGIENPLVQAHVKDKIARLGHVSDASFDSALIRIKPDALGDLVAALMGEGERQAFRKAMVKAGLAKDESLSAALRDGLIHIATKAVGDAAAGVLRGYLEDLGAFLAPLGKGALDRAAAILRAARGKG